jgi:hypothetical protein
MSWVRSGTAVAACFAACGLAGCSSSAGTPPASQVPAHPASAPARSAAPAARPGTPAMVASARAAATTFNRLYLARRFGSSWELLSAAAKQHVPRPVWVGVHDGCRPASVGRARTIRAVTIFGDVAIVTEALAAGSATSGTAEEVFDYHNGRWGFSPQYPNVYQHGSVAADIAAATAAGLCKAWKDF